MIFLINYFDLLISRDGVFSEISICMVTMVVMAIVVVRLGQ